MSKMTYKSKNGQYGVDLESETEVGLVEQLVDFQNLFERNNQCGVCKNDEIYFNIREIDGSRYFEKKCYKCGAALPYHQNKDKVKKGGLYTGWKDKWEKYTPNQKTMKTISRLKRMVKNDSGTNHYIKR